MLELLWGLPAGREAPQTLRTLPLYLFYKIWKWKHLEFKTLSSNLIFTVGRVKLFIGGVWWCCCWSGCQEGQVVGRAANTWPTWAGGAMQPTWLRRQTLPRLLCNVPGKFPYEPTYLRADRPHIGLVDYPLSPFDLWLSSLYLLLLESPWLWSSSNYWRMFMDFDPWRCYLII
jgi:hypothetical protein